MPTKPEIIQNLRDVQSRFELLLPRALEGLSLPLPSGTWTVHDCLCHLAADTNAVASWQRAEGMVQEKALNARAAERVYADLLEMPLSTQPAQVDPAALDAQLAELCDHLLE